MLAGTARTFCLGLEGFVSKNDESSLKLAMLVLNEGGASSMLALNTSLLPTSPRQRRGGPMTVPQFTSAAIATQNIQRVLGTLDPKGTMLVVLIKAEEAIKIAKVADEVPQDRGVEVQVPV